MFVVKCWQCFNCIKKQFFKHKPNNKLCMFTWFIWFFCSYLVFFYALRTLEPTKNHDYEYISFHTMAWIWWIFSTSVNLTTGITWWAELQIVPFFRSYTQMNQQQQKYRKTDNGSSPEMAEACDESSTTARKVENGTLHL